MAEDAAVGAAVGSVQARDTNPTRTITYTILLGNAAGKFTIDGASGAITVAAELDYETRQQYTLTVNANNGAGGNKTTTAAVNVTDVVEDPPPAPPRLSAALADETFTMSWTALGGAAKYEAQHTTDAADAATVTWTALPETTGVSVTYTPEGGPACSTEYRFRVRAYGDGETYSEMWGMESDAASVETATCDPEFDDPSYAFDMAENASVDYVVGTVSATDADMDDVSYSIIAGNTGNVFDIDDETGDITVAGELDHEATDEYTLTVEADDGNGGTDTVTVTVTVTDVAEDAPPAPSGLTASLVDGTFTISWSALDGAAKYEAQHTTDTADAVTVTWTALPETTGVSVTYAPEGGPACSTEYRFRVRAYGDGEAYTGTWGVESDAVSVTTAGCPAEFGQDSYAFEVAEDAAAGDAVGTVSATDADMDDVTYSITGGNTGGVFAIDDETGAITVAAALDYETAAEYTLTVEADDGNGGTDTAAVTITVTDVAEDAPPAPSGLSAALVDGTFTMSWTALDGVAKYEVQHTTDAADAAAVTWTALPEAAGVSVTYAPEGGPACSAEYRFRVRAYGDGDAYTEMWGAESDAVSVETDGCAPAFDQDSYTFEVAEDAAVGDAVGTVPATDPDQADILTYSITGGNEDGNFAIDGSTGAITVAVALDYETTSEYTLTVEVSDGNGGSDTAAVTVTVTDVAEDAPPAPSGLSATLAGGTFTLSWTALDGAAKYEAQHTTDAASAATVTWTALPETTGVSVTYAPDGGPACSTEYRFRVRAYGDGVTYTEMWGSESDAVSVATATCNPEFGEDSYYFFILDTTAADSAVGTVSATDPDTDDTVTYAINRGGMTTGNSPSTRRPDS